MRYGVIPEVFDADEEPKEKRRNDGSDLKLQVFQGHVRQRRMIVLYPDTSVHRLDFAVKPYKGAVHSALLKKRLHMLRVMLLLTCFLSIR